MTEAGDRAADGAGADLRRDVGQRFASGDLFFRRLTLSAALILVLIFLGVIATLAAGAAPAFRAFGLSFLTSESWSPASGKFGAAAAIFGTLVTSAIAIAIAAPIGIGVAIFVSELCPRPVRRPIGDGIEILAGVPSIIYGVWGLFVLAPFFRNWVQPALIGLFKSVPVMSTLFAGPPYGVGVFTASVILAIMILPLTASIAREALEAAPPLLRESAYAVGCTPAEVVRKFLIPHARIALAGGVLLALGRALGETMAVAFVIGNVHRMSASLLAPGTTIPAAIANELPEAVGDLYVSSLIALGLILFAIAFVVLAIARLMLAGLRRKARRWERAGAG